MISVSYDGNSWQAVDGGNSVVTLAAAEQGQLPQLPEGAAIAMLLLPVELLLSRTFSLPLSSSKFIDQEILAQEIEEHTAEQADGWWLSWQAAHDGTGVSGIMFGLPETLRQQIESDESWRSTRVIGADTWSRLQAQLPAQPMADAGGRVAVFDADSTGLFFGVWSGSESANDANGYWLGMRRLNWQSELLSQEQIRAMADNIGRSLHAMGWQGTTAAAFGRLPAALHEALALSLWYGEVMAWSDLPERQTANLALASVSTLNFRHGRWRASSGLGQLKPWYRSMALAAALVVIWMAGMLWQNYQLESQLQAGQQRMIDAFHKGLPQEKVMIDVLAQLRKAAGSGAGDGQQSAVLWLQQLAGINRVYKQTPWEIRELSFQQGKMSMSGQVGDLQSVNRIRQALQQETGMDVKLEDTDLNDNLVRFRMEWL
ncbi:MAG: hypothetical protein AUJ57_01810 [Zetaproteobacteria bacterium CG1_02_53_45]|nr:MAG: hypothetical protein AUJ57_01810 [Zetaproteobacteria bacterium CG1_02_53_45]